ncbi:hypothetical protein BC938DRAFT_481212 [Jimgerdemannia flammicorona]|uniref:Tail specific protease domain-containing protein n=1 Tax=Jimgerdemannia flammicorona TaxID=994334 RepID=A0A433QGL1_9FUNG|nr:hypothetical protein BC938DRAFT_481212 [Jimgerdemannia flammicorona]
MKISTTLSLVASSLALLGSVSAAVDPCTLVSQWPNRTKVDGGWEQSKACLENFPFNNAVAQQTLDTVIDTLDAFFVFKDIAARPPKSQLSIKNVDLIKELKALKNKKYNSDFAFQTDIQNIASSLYDAHLSYSPLCYTRNWDWKQALLLYAPVLNGKQSIKVFDILENYIPSVTADLIDCEVVEIDDKPAFKVIVDFAKEKGGQFKDLNVRFNAAMMSNHFYVNGTFKKYYGTWQNPGQLPTKPLTKYKLQCPNKKAQTLTLPWVVTAPGGNYNDSASHANVFLSNILGYYAQECAVAAPVPMMPSEMGQFHEVPSTHTQDPRSLLVKAGHAHVPHRFDIASNFTLITSDDMFLFGYISKGKGVLYKTGIINIGTFLPADVGHSVQTFHQGLKEFKKLGIEKIILDVQNNFGEFKSNHIRLCKIIWTVDFSFDIILYIMQEDMFA